MYPTFNWSKPCLNQNLTGMPPGFVTVLLCTLAFLGLYSAKQDQNFQATFASVCVIFSLNLVSTGQFRF